MNLSLSNIDLSPSLFANAGGFNAKGAFEGFLGSVGNMLPGAMGNVLGALLILIVGWFIASAVRKLVYNMLNKTNFDNRFLKGSGFQAEKLISKLVYYLLMIIVLMVVLEKLGITEVLTPLQNMVNQFTSYLPNLIGAGVIGFAGYIIATIVSELVGAGGSTIEKYSNKMGISAVADSATGGEARGMDLVGILKKVVFVIIFVPILIAALDALKMRSISDPAKEMLGTFMNSIPNIIAAGIIIGLFYFIGRFVSQFLTDLLKGMNVDSFASKMGLTEIIGKQSLSGIAGKVSFFFIMFFGLVTGLERLGFTQLTGMMNDMMYRMGDIAMGLLILAIGNWIATLASDAISKTDGGKSLAPIVRYGLLGLFLAMSLSTMGLASNIINLAFGLILGAVAVAIALSYGLGGREAAGRHMEEILKKFRR